MESKELSTETFNPTALTIREMSFIANEMVQSKMFPDLASAHQAFVKILAGREMGITPFQAVAGMHVIQGKAVPGGGLLAAAVKGHPKYDYHVNKLDDTGCEIEFFQYPGKLPLGISSFSAENARKAGTKNTEKFPRNMYFNRAMSNGVRWYCPDVTNGAMYVEGELVDEGPVTNSPTEPTEGIGTAEDEPLAPELVQMQTETIIRNDTSPDALQALVDDAFAPNPITPKQKAKIFAVLGSKGIKGDDTRLVLYGLASKRTGAEVTSTNDISKELAMELIDYMEQASGEELRNAGVPF